MKNFINSLFMQIDLLNAVTAKNEFLLKFYVVDIDIKKFFAILCATYLQLLLYTWQKIINGKF